MSGPVYHRAANIADAKAHFEGDAAFLAGGHTLIPAMKTGLRQPEVLIDLAHIPDLAGIREDADAIVVGAMSRHAALAASPILAARLPGLSEAAQLVGDPAVRARGTLGGAIANNDPAADYPAALLALGATIVTDRREIAADDFIHGMFTTALEEGEIVIAVRFPATPQSAYAKFRHPASRYALAGVHVARRGGAVRVGVTGVAPSAFRWTEAESALSARFSPDAISCLALDPESLSSDIHASAEYRAALALAMLSDAVAAAAKRS